MRVVPEVCEKWNLKCIWGGFVESECLVQVVAALPTHALGSSRCWARSLGLGAHMGERMGLLASAWPGAG